MRVMQVIQVIDSLQVIDSIQQSVTYRYREFPVPGVFHFFGGIGTGIGKNWYRKKVPEPVLEKFGTGADFCRQFFLI